MQEITLMKKLKRQYGSCVALCYGYVYSGASARSNYIFSISTIQLLILYAKEVATYILCTCDMCLENRPCYYV